MKKNTTKKLLRVSLPGLLSAVAVSPFVQAQTLVKNNLDVIGIKLEAHTQGGCQIRLPEQQTLQSDQCGGDLLTLDCAGTHRDSQIGTDMLRLSQIALAKGLKVAVEIDEQKTLDDSCYVAGLRLDTRNAVEDIDDFANAPSPVQNNPVALKASTSANTLLNYFKQSLLDRNQLGTWWLESPMEMSPGVGDIIWPEMSAADGMLASDASLSSDVSSTNVIVAGVDEKDRVKTDGRYLYVVNEKNNYTGITPLASAPLESDATSEVGYIEPDVSIYSISEQEPSNTLVQNITLDLQENTSNTIEGIYLSGIENKQQLVTLGSNRAGWDYRKWFSPSYWQSGSIAVNLFDVTEPESPVQGAQISIDGYLVTSRRINDKLYLVTRFSPDMGYNWHPFTEEQVAENAKIIANLTLEEVLPSWSYNGTDQGFLVQADNCYMTEKNALEEHPAIVTVSVIDLQDPSKIDSQCVTGNVGTIFMSADALYLTNRVKPTATSSDTSADQPIEPILLGNPPTNTAVHKFSLSENSLTYRASGEVRGTFTWSANPLFLMGEINDQFALLTTQRDNLSFTPEHLLTVLGEDEAVKGRLKQISTLPNKAQPKAIGKPGEDVYAARFFGKRIYVVTFERIDPLYLIDVADTANPKITAELEIPGFSDYLHPIGEDLLLGIGKEDAIFGGAALKLFDVSDPTNLVVIKALELGDANSFSAVGRDHHSITFLPGNATRPNRITLPFSISRVVDNNSLWSWGWSRWGRWDHTGLYMFEIPTQTNGVEPDLLQVGQAIVATSEDEDIDWTKRNIYGHRAIIQGDAVHYVHGNAVKSIGWGTETQP